MDHKEKYEAALEWAKHIHEVINDVGKKDIEAIFPELSESEDEKIRKELIEQVGYIFPDKEEYDDEGRVLPTYHKRIGRYRAYLEKQKEQKPAEWSEEDENAITEIVCILSVAPMNAERSKELRDWIQHLRPQPHWKPSEEQMVNIEDVLEDVKKNWRKYFKPQDVTDIYNDGYKVGFKEGVESVNSEKMVCPKCGEKMILDEGVVYTSNPPQYGYKCPKCGNYEYSFKKL